jgi:hypothetical protein
MSIMTEHWGFVDGLLARIEGPLSFRLILQPLVALIFAVRDGMKDARERKTAYFWSLFTEPDHRRDILRSSWHSVGKVFIIAIVIDFVFQYLVFDQFRVIGALLAGVILAILPYVLLRGPVNRLMQLWQQKHKP